MNPNYNKKFLINNPVKIYVVVHRTFEETNIFFTDYSDAEKRIHQLVQDTETDVSEWKIITIIEGEPFEADIAVRW